MNVEPLRVRLGDRRIGWLFRYAPENAQPLIRFVADEAYALAPPGTAPVLSASMLAASPAQQVALWSDPKLPEFNSRLDAKGRLQLPPFFQSLLPEGVFRDHVAHAAGCDPDDHYRMLIACGLDLPGAVVCEYEKPTPRQLQRLVTQDQDALEATITDDPLPQDQVSVSGVQPKLLVVLQGDGRYVGRTRDARGQHIIAKLPSGAHAFMPQVESLSMELARAAGVDTCEFRLAALRDLYAQHDYDLPEDPLQAEFFLAVTRFDRRPPKQRIHHETMAQALGVPPDQKYTGATYLDVALLLMALPGCGEAAVHELLRRIAVNELLGNTDMHLANIGLLYADGVTATLSPAYDIVALAVYPYVRGGHALHLISADDTKARGRGVDMLSPTSVRAFCEALRIPVRRAEAVVREAVVLAAREWPAIIAAAPISTRQRARVVGFVASRGIMGGVLRRYKGLASFWAGDIAGAAG